MSDSNDDPANADGSGAASALLAKRVRTLLWLVLAVVPMFGVADVFVNPTKLGPLLTQKAVHILVLIPSLWLLKNRPSERLTVWLVVINVAAALGLTVMAGIEVGDYVTTTALSIVVVILSAAVLPWGVRPHIVVTGLAVAATFLATELTAGSVPAAYIYHLIAVATVWVLSFFLHHELAQRRAAAAREKRERERAERELEKRFKFEHLLTAISLRFINLTSTEIDAGISDALGMIGPFASVDHAYLFLFSDERDTMRLAARWVVDQHPPPLETYANIPCTQMPWLVGPIDRFEVVRCDRVADLPPEAEAERTLMMSRGVESFLMVPIGKGPRPVGFLGFASGTAAFDWDDDRIALLRVVGEIFVNALERKQAQAAVTQSRRQLEREAQIASALAQVGQALIGNLNTPNLLDRLCATTAAVLDCDFSHTWLWNAADDALEIMACSGDPPDVQEAMRAVHLPRALALGMELQQRLENGEVAQIVIGDPARSGGLPSDILLRSANVTGVLCVALRRGDQVIGAQVAGLRGRPAAFTSEQERILLGIGQLASMAFENARLVDQLERANLLKSEFVANMSHELRTPLNVILGYTDLIATGACGPTNPDLDDVLQRMNRSANQLNDLVDATLDFGRLESDRMPFRPADIDLRAFIDEVDEETRVLRYGSPVLFRWEVADRLPLLRTDPVKLKVILKNLLSNAFKFTEAGEVTASVAASDGGVEFAVRDTGIGIRPEFRSALFEPFRQADGSMTRAYGGVGLGLHVSRRLVAVMGGRLDYTSEVDRGSTFRVWVPVTPPAMTAAVGGH